MWGAQLLCADDGRHLIRCCECSLYSNGCAIKRDCGRPDFEKHEKVKELKSKLKKQSRATVARGKACSHMMQEVMVKNVVQLLTVAYMIRKAESKAECARWDTFLDRFDTEAGNYCQRYSKIDGMSQNMRIEVLAALEECESRADNDFPDEFEPPCIHMSGDFCKLYFDRFQVIKTFRKMKDFYKCNVSERCYKVIKRDKHGRVIKVIRRLRMKGCKMSP